MRFVLCLVFAGCATESWFELGIDDGPFAVGAHVSAGASSSNCQAGERGSQCSFDTVTTTSVAIEPPGIFEQVPSTSPAIDLVALADGIATLTVVADNGDETKTFTRVLQAFTVDGIRVTPSLRDQPCASPVRFAIGTRTTLPLDVLHGDTKLAGRAFVPITLSTGMIDTAHSTIDELALTFADTPGAVQLTSPAVPEFSLALETFAPAQVEAIALGEPASPWFPLSPAVVPIDLIAGGEPVCGDGLSRTVTTETPDVCTIYEDNTTSTTTTAAGLAEVHLRAKATGTCTIRVTLDGTSLTAMRTMTVSAM